MGLPQQVQKQADAAEQFDKKVAEAQAAAAQPQGEQAVAQPPAEEANKPPVAEPVAPARNDEEVALWKQRFQSLQGMYNSQVPTLQAQVKQLTDRLAEMEAAKQQQPQKPPQGEGLVTKTDVEAFGEDLIDVARRIAREELARQAAAHEAQIAQLTEKLNAARQNVEAVAQDQAMSKQEVFFDALSRAVPKWKEIQETAECQTFLGTNIPGTRTEWNTALVDAANRHDVQAVTEVFEQFFARYPKYAPKRPTQQSQSNRSELERQVTPSKTGAGAAPPQGKRMYTGPEYEQESMRIVRLAQQGKHDDAARLEAELNAALTEGRIR